MNDNAKNCFHCGLPLSGERPPSLEILDKPRQFCCSGCHAVASSIVDAGLQDYYQKRQQASATGSDLEQVLEQLRLYDREEIQKSFVHKTQDWHEATLILERIRCPSCLWLNEQHLRQLHGMQDVQMDYTSERATVRWDPDVLQLSDILLAITNIGYIAHPFDPKHRQRLLEDSNRRSIERLIIAGAGMMITMQFAFGSYLMGPSSISPTDGSLPLWMIIGRWTSLGVALLLLAWPAQDFFVGAWRDIQRRQLGMDVPIVLGLISALLGSLHSTIVQSGEVYYDSIGMFIFFLLIARRIEFKGRQRAAAHLDKLALITPESVEQILNDGTDDTVTTAVIDLQVGDQIRLLPGQTLPVDGRLLSKNASVDESLLSGEAEAVCYQQGDELVAGAIIIDQSIVLEVLHLPKESTLETLRELLHKGRQYKPRLALLSEQVASYFVPVLLLLATITAVSWAFIDPTHALANTIAVLIVTCPCALALATPVALSIASAELSRHGLLALNMSAIETLATAKHLVLDKTGTLTQGHPRLQSIKTSSGFNKQQALNIAQAIARHSRHPISLALSREPCEFASITIRHIKTQTGQGLEGQIDHTQWKLGNLAWTNLQSSAALTTLKDASTAGQLSVILSDSNQQWAIFLLRDELRNGAQTLVPQLQKLGMTQATILSGDRKASVASIADQLAIKHYLAEQNPQQKLEWIQHRQSQQESLLMVGDGINDAPTLAAADVSVSFTTATDLAQAHSDFSLLNNDLQTLVYARQLAQKTRRVILQNFSWALTYNILAIPAAMLGWVPPWAAAIGMSVSSLIVVSNSLRLQKQTP